MQVTDLAYIDPVAGYYYADFPTFLAYYQALYQGIYGADVYLGSDSQDGQFVTSLAQAAFDYSALGAATLANFNPSSAQGVSLARLVKLNGLRKLLPSSSTVDLTVTGTVGTIITGGIASDSLNQKWVLPATVTIPAEGFIIVTATSAVTGALTALPGTVTTIFTPTQGWQSVTNANAATPGAPVETDAELRMRRAKSTGLPSLTVLQGITGSIANLTGVTNVRGYENDSNTTDANGIPANSMCIVVAGGDSNAIANTIVLKKTQGSPTYGNTTVNVLDPKGLPVPIRFQRPTLASIKATVTITALNGYSSGFATQIQQAVAAVINSFDIGTTVLITKLYYPSYLSGSASGSTYDVITITIGKNSGTQASTNIPLNFDELPYCNPDTDVTVTVTT